MKSSPRPPANPVLSFALERALRGGGLPWALLAVLLAVASGVAFVAHDGSPALTPGAQGSSLFHSLFAALLLGVLALGPVLSATAIAGEREGDTWQPLALTGLGANRIAQGKFWANYVLLATAITLAAPFTALPLLLGGVSLGAVLAALALLYLAAVVAVLVGLAVSARCQTTRAALIVSTIVGSASALAAWHLWCAALGELTAARLGVPATGPLWWPILLADGSIDPSDRAQLAALTLGPLALLVASLYALTASALGAPAAALRRTYVAVGAVLTAGLLALSAPGEEHLGVAGRTLDHLGVVGAYGVLGVLLFLSRRRAMTASVRAVLRAQLAALVLLVGVGLLRVPSDERGASVSVLPVALFALRCGLFVWSCAGVGVWVRARAGSLAARAAVLLWLCALWLFPLAEAWLPAWPWLAHSSPSSAWELTQTMVLGTLDDETLTASALWSGALAMVGAWGLWRGAQRTRRAATASEKLREKVEKTLREEDAS